MEVIGRSEVAIKDMFWKVGRGLTYRVTPVLDTNFNVESP